MDFINKGKNFIALVGIGAATCFGAYIYLKGRSNLTEGNHLFYFGQ